MGVVTTGLTGCRDNLMDGSRTVAVASGGSAVDHRQGLERGQPHPRQQRGE